jgi:DNA invertase Pin-like site-specific DNA recombinase
VVVIYAPVPTNLSLWHYCMARGWEDVHVVTRPEELLRAIRSGKVEIVVASSLNGLGRSVSQLVQVLREFVSLRVILLIPNSRIDTSKMSSKVFLDTLDAIEEFKGAVSAENIAVGLAAARARGDQAGPTADCGP